MFIIKIIFFDTETSGLNCHFCKIIELAMLTVENGKIIEEYDEFINIGQPLEPKITRLTGISDETLRREGIDEEIVANDLKERLTKGTLMVAHNCYFDLSFVYQLLKRHFPSEAYDIVSNVDWIDTLTVFKDRRKFPHKLIDAVEKYGIEMVNFHRAIEDTKVLYQVTLAMKVERDDLRYYKNIFGYNPKYPIYNSEFKFIKFKSQPYRNVDSKVGFEDILPNK